MLSAPFPYFGGKSRVARHVWERFGNVPNYVEPFAGSLAVLLARPHAPGTETVNDIDSHLSNFWRAVKAVPDEVARWADWPVNEADLHARHRWLVGLKEFRERMKTEPEFFDAKVAGWWVWGLCGWIGSGWCVARGDEEEPHLGDAGRGIQRQLPHLGNAGMGLHRKLPHLGAGRGAILAEWFAALARRLERVRVACGDWTRVLGPSVTEAHGVTAVFLDPPYSYEEHAIEYAGGGRAVADDVRAWAVEHGERRELRIALCGYEGEHTMPSSWRVLAWKTKGGYGSQGNGEGRANARRERVWFSPHCLGTTLFEGDAAEVEEEEEAKDADVR